MSEPKTLTYHSKLVGVTFEGRQDVIKSLRGKEPLRVRREKDNKYDPRAVAVDVYKDDEWIPIGYIAKDKNKDISETLDAGNTVYISIGDITGGGDRSYGVNISLEYKLTEEEAPEARESVPSKAETLKVLNYLTKAIEGAQNGSKHATEAYTSPLTGETIELEVVSGHKELKGFMSGSKFPEQFYQPFDREGILAAMAEKYNVDADAIEAMWNLNNEASTGYGTAIHAALENYDRNFKLGDKTKFVKEFKTKPTEYGPNRALSKNPFIKKIVEDFQEKFGGDYERLSEVFIWDAGLKLCGSIDRVKFIDRKKKIVRIQDFKGLDLNTPIPTPGGFVKMKDLRVGDSVYDKDGDVVVVKNKSQVHHRDCYRITLEDGSELISDNEHRWWASAGRTGSPYKIITSDEMYNIKGAGETVRIPVQGAIYGSDKELPIDPYVLGVWLADGNSHSGMITEGANSGIFDEIVSRGYDLGDDTDPRDTVCARTVLGLSGELKKLNLLKNKHIPEIYLFASYNQRLDLLRGLMDGDGSWNVARRLAVMSTTKRWQADGLKSLVSSLGMRAYKTLQWGEGFGKKVQVYHISFNPTVNPFLTRNQNIAMRRTAEQSVRYVKSIEKIDSVPTQCIEVTGGSHTYLAGTDFVVTHNTDGNIHEKKYQLADSPFKDKIGNELLDYHWLQLSFYAFLLEIKGYTVEGLDIYWLNPEKLCRGENAWEEFSSKPIDIREVIING